MTLNSLMLIASVLAMVLLSFVVGLAMLFARVREMRTNRIHPQAVSTSMKMAARLENVQPADNFRNLFEVPVLFYALIGIALAVGFAPGWLVVGAWVFVALRVVHSVIHCTYNKVYHRLGAFVASFLTVVVLWLAFLVSVSVGSLP